MSGGGSHTPGPWVFTENASDFTVRSIDEGKAIIARTSQWSSAAGRDERRANARLIAAAPELLEALEKADALIESLWKAVPWGQTYGLDIAALNEVPPQMKRAIAKARGESS